MYYKAIFQLPINDIFELGLPYEYDPINANNVINYEGHIFELIEDNSGKIIGFTYYNQCIKTYDIENVFLKLINNLINDDDIVELYDSSGSIELYKADDLKDNI